MKFQFFVAARYLLSRRKGLFALITTVIGVAGVSVGVAALLTTLSVMNGFQSDIQKRIVGAQSHVAIFGGMDRPGYAKVEKDVLALPEVEAVAPVAFGQAILAFRERSIGLMLKGLDVEKEARVNTLSSSITKGGWKSFVRPGEQEAPPPIVLGAELASNMGLFIGDDVVLISPKSVASAIGIMPKMRKFRVSGFIRTGYYEFDNSMAYLHLDEASNFLSLNGDVTGMEIKLKDINKAEKTAQKIKTIAPFPSVVRTFAQMNRTLYAALKLEKFVMFLILILIVLVAALNIASNLILMGTEKLRDIGLYRAMGATAAHIRGVFFCEGFLIATSGIVIGLALGFTLCWAIATFNFVELPGDIYYVTKVPVDIRLSDVLLIIGGSYLMCFIATLYPAARASSVSPVDAIRYG